MPSFDSITNLSETAKTGLRNLLLACADTKLLLGYHYGEWTFGPPEIEAAVACCSLCQSELGHVRLLHGILTKHYDDDPDILVEKRSRTEFANITFLDNEIKNWAEFVAANYIVDLAVTMVLNSMRESTFMPLHMSLEKMLQEERYHIHHGQGWFRTLSQKSDETRKELEKSARKALRSVLEWFGPVDSNEDKELVDLAIKSQTNSEIASYLADELGQMTKSLNIDIGLTKSNSGWIAKEAIQWNGWNPQTRRVSESGPDERILYHLRGSKNEVFKIG